MLNTIYNSTKTDAYIMREIFASISEQGSGSHRGVHLGRTESTFPQFNLGPILKLAARKRSKFGGQLASRMSSPWEGCGERKEKGIGWREGASRPAKPAAADSPFRGRKGGNHERTRIFCKRPISQKPHLLLSISRGTFFRVVNVPI